MPYVLPIASILAIASLLIFARPAITGFFIAQPSQVLNAEIRITASEVLPEDAMLHVYLEKDKNVKDIISLSIKDFLIEYGDAQNYLERSYGKNRQLSYEGYGYLGNYTLDIQNFDVKDLDSGTYFLYTKIIWQNGIVSERKQEVRL